MELWQKESCGFISGCSFLGAIYLMNLQCLLSALSNHNELDLQ